MFKLQTCFFASVQACSANVFHNADDKVYIDPLLIPNPFINGDITSQTRTSYYKISHETVMRLKESKLPRAEKEKRHVSVFAPFLNTFIPCRPGRWAASADKKAVVDSMPESEAKRRRYVK